LKDSQLIADFELAILKTKEAFYGMQNANSALYKSGKQYRKQMLKYETELIKLKQQCVDLQKQLKEAPASLARKQKASYLQQGKEFNIVECLICWESTEDVIRDLYIDPSNRGFHCSEHEKQFHEIVKDLWPCCEPQAPQDL